MKYKTVLKYCRLSMCVYTYKYIKGVNDRLTDLSATETTGRIGMKFGIQIAIMM